MKNPNKLRETKTKKTNKTRSNYIHLENNIDNETKLET